VLGGFWHDYVGGHGLSDAYKDRARRKIRAAMRRYEGSVASDEQLALEIGIRARDIAATADMLRLDEPLPEDLLDLAAFMTFWAAATRRYPATGTGTEREPAIDVGITVQLLATEAFTEKLPAELAKELLVPDWLRRRVAPHRPEELTLHQTDRRN
jgi:hypothetical protein